MRRSGAPKRCDELLGHETANTLIKAGANTSYKNPYANRSDIYRSTVEKWLLRHVVQPMRRRLCYRYHVYSSRRPVVLKKKQDVVDSSSRNLNMFFYSSGFLAGSGLFLAFRCSVKTALKIKILVTAGTHFRKDKNNLHFPRRNRNRSVWSVLSADIATSFDMLA